MELGFSFKSQAVQPVANATPAAATATGFNPLFARIAAQMGAINSFFKIIDTNRYFVARSAIIYATEKEDDTMDKKIRKNIIRTIKTEKTEPSNDQRPQ